MANKKKQEPAPAEAEPTTAAEGDEAPPKKGGKLKLIIIGVLGLLIVGGGGVFVGMTFLGGGGDAPATLPVETAPEPGEDTEEPITAPTELPEDEEGEAAAEGEEGAAVEEDTGPQNIEFKSFIVNLGGSGGKRFLKLTMSVEAEDADLADEINQKMPQFRDIILLLLSSLAYEDIATLDGKLRLRNQILNRLNTQLTEGKVKNIYFSEFVVQ